MNAIINFHNEMSFSKQKLINKCLGIKWTLKFNFPKKKKKEKLFVENRLKILENRQKV